MTDRAQIARGVQAALGLVAQNELALIEGLTEWVQLRQERGDQVPWENIVMIRELRYGMGMNKLSLNGEDFYFEGRDYDDDFVYARVPVLFFTDPDAAVVQLDQDIADAKAAHERAQQEAEQRLVERAKEFRRQQYLELKKEFGNDTE